jgi:hypothetical protein
MKLSAEKRNKPDKAQRQRFIDAAREAGASEDGAEFDKNLRRLANAKPAHKERNDDRQE